MAVNAGQWAYLVTNLVVAYDAGGDRLLMVASDRVSAFDVVMAEPIPDKGRVLTGMTAFWLDLLRDVAPNHLVSVDPADYSA